LSFGEPRCVTQLQAADLFAYEIYQELKFQLKNVNEVPWRKPARSQLQTICRSLHIEGRIAGVPFLHACSNSMDDLASVVDAAKTASPS
jgi:hypothetical protein